MQSPESQSSPLSREALIALNDKALKTVKNYAFGSAGIGLVPIPLVDLIALTGVQLKMVSDLADHYGQVFSENLVRSLIGTFLGWTIGNNLFMPIASIFKAIPGIGTVAGGAATATLSSASTYALGKVFIEHFAAGGTILTLDPLKVRDYYEHQFEAQLKQQDQPKIP